MSKLNIVSLASNEAHLADRRCRIVRESYPRSPAENEDLVFVSTATKYGIPEDAIYTWQRNGNGDYYYTTAERCRQMVSPDPSCWTQEKLAGLAKIEEQLWNDWFDGRVYGYIIEDWDPASRVWKHVNSCWGYYGIEAIQHGIKDAVGKDNIIVCAEDDVKAEVE